MNSFWENPNGDTPFISEGTFVDPSAVIIGNVRIGENCYIGPNVTIRADEVEEGKVEPVIIEDNVGIFDNTAIHSRGGSRAVIGEGSTVGHGCVIHGPCHLKGNVFVGYNCVIDRARVGEGSIIMHKALIYQVDVADRKFVTPGDIITEQAQAFNLDTVPEEYKDFVAEMKNKNMELANNYRMARQRERRQ